MTKSRDIANSTSTLDVDGGTIKLDGNYPVGTSNVALGDTALDSLGSGNYNTAVGHHALTANTDGGSNTGLGFKALFANTTGVSNTSVGTNSLDANTTGDNNVAMGQSALGTSTTGSSNTAIGSAALASNTTASNNVAIGKDAGGLNSTGGNNTFVGKGSGYSTTSGSNTFAGHDAGLLVTSGAKNTILGRYNGNQGGLDIRTSSNNVVLSDGDGNIILSYESNGNTTKMQYVYSNTTSTAANVAILASGTISRSTSSRRYKNTITDATHGLTELLALRPVTFKGNNDGDTVFGGLIAEEVHDAGLTEFVQYNDDAEPDALAYGNMVSLCIKAIQELSAKNDALEARIATLEG